MQRSTNRWSMRAILDWEISVHWCSWFLRVWGGCYTKGRGGRLLDRYTPPGKYIAYAPKSQMGVTGEYLDRPYMFDPNVNGGIDEVMDFSP